ncbi:MAG: hypothetical protein MI863_19885 [Desulfobacterales bacterium]|nr:hypothetical protein [Desulfobacterales bacterium]
MKTVGLRIAGIGIFHMILYGYLVPFVIYPRFGNNGLTFAIIVAVVVSIAVLGTLWLGKSNKRAKGE